MHLHNFSVERRAIFIWLSFISVASPYFLRLFEPNKTCHHLVQLSNYGIHTHMTTYFHNFLQLPCNIEGSVCLQYIFLVVSALASASAATVANFIRIFLIASTLWKFYSALPIALQQFPYCHSMLLLLLLFFPIPLVVVVVVAAVGVGVVVCAAFFAGIRYSWVSACGQNGSAM